MKIRLDNRYTLRTDACNFALEGGPAAGYWSDLPPLIEKLRKVGYDAYQLADVSWLETAMACQYQAIDACPHPIYDAFPVGYDRIIGDDDRPLGAILRTRKDIYALQLWLPWRGRKGENGRYHVSANVLLKDLFAFSVRRLGCRSFEDAVRETNALGATIAAWRSGLAATPVKKARFIGCGDGERIEAAHVVGQDAPRPANAACERPHIGAAA